MFKHRYKFFFIAFLAVYSFLNIIVLEGDRLFQAELPKDYLFYTIVFLCIAVWFANLTVEVYLLRKFKNVHPLLVQFGASIVAVLIICLVSVELTELILGYPFNFTKQNLLLTSGFTFRINLFLNSLNAIYFFSQRYKEKAV
ncbi:signal transduction histidine kinase, partial [Marivirga lumbricoides]